jgi:uncharacterized protein YwbE
MKANILARSRKHPFGCKRDLQACRASAE